LKNPPKNLYCVYEWIIKKNGIKHHWHIQPFFLLSSCDSETMKGIGYGLSAYSQQHQTRKTTENKPIYQNKEDPVTYDVYDKNRQKIGTVRPQLESRGPQLLSPDK